MSVIPNPTPPIAPPDLRDVLQGLRREIFSSLKCAVPGIIQNFNSSRQTAEIKIALQATVGTAVQNYPLLVDCPCVILGGGGGVLTFPIQQGDTCLVLFCDRSIDNWFSTGNVAPPDQQRAHSLADGIALVGIHSLANSVGSYSTDGAEFRLGGGKVRITATGEVILTSAGGATIDMNTMVGFGNATSSLKTILDALMTTLTNWVNTDSTTPNPATVAAIALIKLQIDSLFQ